MKKYSYILLTVIFVLFLSVNDVLGQRMAHKGGSRSGGNRAGGMSKSPSRSINGGAKRSASRPKTKNYINPKTSN
jgi:hypothetical protein